MTIKEITPTDSACPVFLEPLDTIQIEADKTEYELRIANLEAKVTQRQAILDRLGLTAEEAALLLGGN
jgi:hypothetical protein